MHLAQHNLVYKRSAFQTYCSEHPSAFAANNGAREPKCQNFGKNAENFARILKAVQYPFSSFIFVIIVIIIIAIIVIIVSIVIISVIIVSTIMASLLVESLSPIVFCCLHSAL